MTIRKILSTVFAFIGLTAGAHAAVGTGIGGSFIQVKTTLQQGATFYVSSGTVTNLNTNLIKFSDGSTQTSASAGGGGSASTMQTKVNGVQISSPTKSLAFDSNFTGLESPTGTANISLNPGTTLYIQNTNSLQSGATIYVSSESVNGPLSVFRSNFQALLLPSTTIPFELVNTTSHQLYMIFKTSGTEWWRLGSDVTGLGTPEYDVYNVTTGIKDIAISTNDVMNINATASFPSLTASRPMKLNASKQVTSGLIDVTTDLTGVVPDANLPSNLVHTNSTSYIQNSNTLQSGSTFYTSSGSVNGQLDVYNVPSSSFGSENDRMRVSLSNNLFGNGNLVTFTALGGNTPRVSRIRSEGLSAATYSEVAISSGSFGFNDQNGSLFSGSESGLVAPYGITGSTLKLAKGPQTWNGGETIDLDLIGRYTFSGIAAESVVGRVRALVTGTNGGSGAPYGGTELWATRLNGPVFTPMFAVFGSTAGVGGNAPDHLQIGPGVDPTFSGATLPVALDFIPVNGDTATLAYTHNGDLSFSKTVDVPQLKFPDGTTMTTAASGGGGAGTDLVTSGVVGSNSGLYNFFGTTVTFAAPPVDTSDRVPILNNGAVTWPLAVTDGARLGSTQTFTGADIFTSTSGVNVTYGVVGGSLTATVEATLPNGTNPTISTTGDMAVDTSSGQVVVSTNGSSGNVVLPYYIPNSIVIATPTVGDYHFFVKAKREWTVDSVVCVSSASTSATVQLFECDANGANCTSMDSATACTTTETAITMTDTDITAGDRVKVMVTATSGTPGEVAVDLYALETRK